MESISLSRCKIPCGHIILNIYQLTQIQEALYQNLLNADINSIPQPFETKCRHDFTPFSINILRKSTFFYLTTISRTSLVIHWIRHHLPVQRVQIRSLVEELRPHMPCDQKTKNVKQKQYCNIFNKDFKNSPTLKNKNFLKNHTIITTSFLKSHLSSVKLGFCFCLNVHRVIC